MTSIAELSNDTQDLLRQAVEQSEYLEGSDPLDKTVAHLARTYVIAGGSDAHEELGEEGEPSTEVKERQAELREEIMENL